MNIQILDRLAVLWGDCLAGELALDCNGAMRFDFDAEADELAALLRTILDACLAEPDHKENPPAA